VSSRTLKLALPLLLVALLLPANALAEEVVKDGSFEATPDSGPNPNWQEGGAFAPICDADCGDGGGTAGPRTGGYWAWFGGVFNPDFQSVTQEVTIPPGPATLTFYLWLGASSGNGLDTLRVFLGNEELFAVGEDATGYDSYKPVTVDVTKHAGLGPQDLSFEFEGFGGTPTNFSLDDISLQAGSAATAAVTLKGPKKVAQGKKAKLTVSVQPCAGHAGETVELFRGKKKVRSAVADAACVTKFKVKVKRTSSFRAVSPAGTSNKLKIRIRKKR
jgi:hypothetical protein